MEHITSLSQQLTDLRLGSETPAWAKILIHCVGELVDIVKVTNGLNDRLVVLESVNEIRGSIIENLRQENVNLKKEIASIAQATDRNEQKSRSSCLLLHGIEELEGENTDDVCLKIINDDVGVPLSLDDIERSHRIGPRKLNTRSAKPRPIIFRFASMRKRMEVFLNKKKLKGKKTVITESLTAYRYDLLKKAQSKYGDKMVWSSEGRIFTRLNDKLVLISSEADLK